MIIHIQVQSFNQVQNKYYRRTPIIIGRRSTACLTLKGWRIASFHAQIIEYEGQLFIEDQGSLQGTMVNFERIKHYGPIKKKDKIVIGPYILSVFLNKNTTQLNEIESANKKSIKNEKKEFSINSNFKEINNNRKEKKILNNSKKSKYMKNKKIKYEQKNNYTLKKEFNLYYEPYIKYKNKIKKIKEKVLKKLNLREIAIGSYNEKSIFIRVKEIAQQEIKNSHIDTTANGNKILDFILADICGLGILEPLLKDDRVTEIMVNGTESIFVELDGYCYVLPICFSTEQDIRYLIERIVAPLGRRVDENTPMVDARLADGSRVHIILPPIALNGPIITIRKFSHTLRSWQDLINNQTLSAQLALKLQKAVKEKKNIIISGGTGSGKTTLLNILSTAIPAYERVITIEDAAELKLNIPNLVRLEARPANAEGVGLITIRELVRNALRMRPDRIIVGECRGPEAFDMLSAMNTGHEGSLSTLHANSPREALHRLESLVLMAQVGLPFESVRDYIAMSLDLIVQIERNFKGKRVVKQLSKITGIESDVIQLEDIYVK